MVRAKFRVTQVAPGENGSTIYAEAVTAENENKSWSEATPSGNLSIFISNADALVHFQPEGELSGEFYLEFIPCH